MTLEKNNDTHMRLTYGNYFFTRSNIVMLLGFLAATMTLVMLGSTGLSG